MTAMLLLSLLQVALVRGLPHPHDVFDQSDVDIRARLGPRENAADADNRPARRAFAFSGSQAATYPWQLSEDHTTSTVMLTQTEFVSCTTTVSSLSSVTSSSSLGRESDTWLSETSSLGLDPLTNLPAGGPPLPSLLSSSQWSFSLQSYVPSWSPIPSELSISYASRSPGTISTSSSSSYSSSFPSPSISSGTTPSSTITLTSTQTFISTIPTSTSSQTTIENTPISASSVGTTLTTTIIVSRSSTAGSTIENTYSSSSISDTTSTSAISSSLLLPAATSQANTSSSCSSTISAIAMPTADMTTRTGAPCTTTLASAPMSSSIASSPAGPSPTSILILPSGTAAPSSTVSVSTVETTVVSYETTSFTTILVSVLTTSQAQSITTTPSTSQIITTPTSISPAPGNPTLPPFNTTVLPSPSSVISPITTGTEVISKSAVSTTPMASNIFVPVASGPPPPQIASRSDYPVPAKSILRPGNGTLQTNKFYANLFLGNQTQGTWTHPYSVSMTINNATGGKCLAVSHVDASRRAFAGGNPPQFFINPLGLQSFTVSATELGTETNMTLDTLTAFSVNVNLVPRPGANPALTFPLVQGMGFITGVFKDATPQLGSSIFFRSLTYGGIVSGSTTARYEVSLLDGTSWIVYMTPSQGYALPTLTLLSGSQIVGNKAFSGILQIAKNPDGGPQNIRIYDVSAGVFPVAATVSASVDKADGSYTFNWTKGGVVSKPLLMFALPHHVESLSPATAQGLQASLQLQTTTKGMATAIIGDTWTLVETNLPYDMDFTPWSPSLGKQRNIAAAARALISNVASSELAQDINAQTALDSMYFSGKGLAKFAFTVYAAADIGGSTGVASAGLVRLKEAFSLFVNNRQPNPLSYDTVWGGVVSNAGYSNSGADFGNTYYNDHHFHYGYFVYTAAVIGYLDPSWLEQGSNKAWTNTLVRDYANSDPADAYFPFSRMYDWYHGHSWAHGLYETGDGKDEESSSEDAFSSYALKMWGRTTGDANLEARGNLMLSITARSLRNYFLYQNDNTVQPPQFIPNRVAGILFENKIDHTTYFGNVTSYIQGIHMMPLNPSSALTRNPTFVRQEWDTYFSNGRVDQVEGGWRGLLYANLALIDAPAAYAFFAQPNFRNEWLDGGASRTWYLAFCAGLGGALE